MSGWSGTISTPGVTASSKELEAVRRHLAPGEHIEWIGRPDRKRLFALFPVDEWIIIPAFVAFAATITLEILGAIYGPRGSWAFSVFVFCTVSVLSGYLAFGRIFRRAYRKRRAVYAVTNRRVLVIVGRHAANAASLDALPRISPNTDDFGQGTLYFEIPRELGLPQTFRWYGPGASASSFSDVWLKWPPSFAFYDIDYPSTVAKLIKRLRDEESGP